jgi:hypothetical protein
MKMAARSSQREGEPTPLFCDRCTTELTSGAGTFYRVVIDAVADPAPPVLSADDTEADVGTQIKAVLEKLQGLSAQEAMDQVHRRLTIHLCTPCYREWIENPTG